MYKFLFQFVLQTFFQFVLQTLRHPINYRPRLFLWAHTHTHTHTHTHKHTHTHTLNKFNLTLNAYIISSKSLKIVSTNEHYNVQIMFFLAQFH